MLYLGQQADLESFGICFELAEGQRVKSMMGLWPIMRLPAGPKDQPSIA